jgi:hypothetical protein
MKLELDAELQKCCGNKKQQLPHKSLRGLLPTLIEIRCGKVSLRMLDKSNKK